MSRIVVTGMGMLSPLGVGLSHNWKNLIAGKSGLISTTSFENFEKDGWDKIPSRVVGKVPSGSISDGKWNPNEHFTANEQRRIGTFTQYGLVCAKEALTDAKLLTQENTLAIDPLNVGVAVGSGIGSFEDLYDNAAAFSSFGYKKVQPLFVPKMLNNMAAGNISIKYQTKGPIHSVSTACATGLQAIGDAFNFIKLGYCDVMICGGTESSVHPLALAGFARAKSVTTASDEDPSAASRPFDKDRSGFVLGEGCGILVLESLEHAIKRGVTEDQIYGEILGYGISGDGYHITAPREDGEGAYNAMHQALTRAEIKPEQIDYVNAHATSTVIGDKAENNAMLRLLDPKITKVSATKSSIGHLLGAAGAVESIFTLNAIKTGKIPPTLNLQNIGQHPQDDPKQFQFDYMANNAISQNIDYALNNSFGFGGVNSSLCIAKFSR
ncbi:hypothetical protein G210_0178 [Candida maltosa Xu316]|uniref:3-oxoacyl-[acyl-carrier-protein] synthase n=1 Tax=Candida maltosa (strain Xu316) TaxID=1245528 RepID=M3K335_CANMX|nr:hypothetical protein G210_0178 [Candida maltosa Xu316]